MDDKVPLSEFVGRVRVRGANSLGTPPGEGDGLQAAAQAHRHVGLQIRGVGVQASAGLVAGDDAVLSSDIVRLVAQWLGDAGLTLTQRSLLDEAAVGRAARAEAANDVVRLKRSISDGDWADVDRLLATPLVRNQRSLVYAAYRQQFLECIDHHDVQKAFTFLNKRLKPLESLQTTPAEFRDLCYLLTAKSVHDAPSFRNWEGVAGGREKLVDQLQSMVDFEYSADNDHEESTYVPPHRLLTLLRQAVAYQIEFSRYHPKIAPKIKTLLHDYTNIIIPNALRHTFEGHRSNVKCVEFIGEEGNFIASGSSDNTVRLWNIETGECRSVLEGHLGRIWDVASNKSGSILASASGDESVRLWDLRQLYENSSTDALPSSQSSSYNNDGDLKIPCLATLGSHLETGNASRYAGFNFGALSSSGLNTPTSATGSYSTTFNTTNNGGNTSGGLVGLDLRHGGDVYSVKWHPGGSHIVTGGYDKIVRFFDVNTGQIIKTFTGHGLSASKCIFNPMGNLIVSGSKDNTIKFWDTVSGVCIKTIATHLGEVTNVELNSNGTLLLSSSKDNSNRLWDLRMVRPLRRYRGHQNTSKNFVRAGFAGDGLIVGGSEDGLLYIWDQEKGSILQRLKGHSGAVYNGVWHPHQSLYVSCSDDRTVRSWWFDDSKPLFADDDDDDNDCGNSVAVLEM